CFYFRFDNLTRPTQRTSPANSRLITLLDMPVNRPSHQPRAGTVVLLDVEGGVVVRVVRHLDRDDEGATDVDGAGSIFHYLSSYSVYAFACRNSLLSKNSYT